MYTQWVSWTYHRIHENTSLSLENYELCNQHINTSGLTIIWSVIQVLWRTSVLPVSGIYRSLTRCADPRVGADHFDEAMSYVEKHQLYESALSIWRKTDQHHVGPRPSYLLYPSWCIVQIVLSLYGEWLFERRDFKQAAIGKILWFTSQPYVSSSRPCVPIVFIEAEKASKAMVAYEKSLQWRELFELAGSEETIHGSDVISMAYRVAGRSISSPVSSIQATFFVS